MQIQFKTCQHVGSNLTCLFGRKASKLQEVLMAKQKEQSCTIF